MGFLHLDFSGSRCARLLVLATALGLMVSCSKDAKKKTVLNADPDGLEQLEAVDPNPEPEALEEIVSNPTPTEVEESFDDSSVVSFLGYHDFTLSRSPNEMLIREDKFRGQMQMLRDAGIEVISMEKFLQWRRREAPLPKNCVVITADDGWREVHTYMLPIMKEFGYPFTVFIYTNFLDSGGRTLTQAQVEEIMGAGGTIGSHSVSHRDMNRVKLGKQSVSFGQFERMRTAYSKGLEELDQGASSVQVEGVRRSRAAVEAKLGELAEALKDYDEWIIDELQTSKQILETKFGVPVETFAYPYGPYNDRIVKLAMDAGYEALITVNGAKANFETPLGEIPRFIIHGGDDRNWRMATSFGGAGGLDGEGDLLKPRETADGIPEEVLIKVSPAEGEVVANRQPLIQFDYSKLDGVEPTSLSMRVGGFGTVPAILDEGAKILSWQVPRKLRNDTCQVQVSLKQGGKSQRVAWSFAIDKLVLYTPDYDEQFQGAVVDDAVPKAIPVGSAN